MLVHRSSAAPSASPLPCRLSHDGAAWSRHAVPARADVDAHLATVLDGDLVVVLGGDGGTDVRIMRDVEKVLDEAGGGDA